MNMHDEVNPWVIIIVALPNIPNLELEVILIINRPIWLIEEYAINAFRSIIRRHIILIRMDPRQATEIIMLDIEDKVDFIIFLIRINP